MEKMISNIEIMTIDKVIIGKLSIDEVLSDKMTGAKVKRLLHHF